MTTITPEQIAKEAADSFVTIVGALRREIILGTPVRREESGPVWEGNTSHLLPAEDATDTLVLAGKLRRITDALVLAAIERALRTVPVPTPVDQFRLDEIRASVEAGVDPEGERRYADEQAMFVDLVAHVDHLHRMMHSPEGEAISDAFRRGRESVSPVQ